MSSGRRKASRAWPASGAPVAPDVDRPATHFAGADVAKPQGSRNSAKATQAHTAAFRQEQLSCYDTELTCDRTRRVWRLMVWRLMASCGPNEHSNLLWEMITNERDVCSHLPALLR
jgi:hypothetical protein